MKLHTIHILYETHPSEQSDGPGRFTSLSTTTKKLLLKLKVHGIGDGIIDWIEQWLTDRRQRVVVDGEVSNWKSVLSGVPQSITWTTI